MHIGIAGPLATKDIEHLLTGDASNLPREMQGATLLAALIEELISLGHHVSAFTTDPSLHPSTRHPVIGRGKSLDVYYVPRRRRTYRFDRGSPGRMIDFFRIEREALSRAMASVRPEIIHAHWSYEFAQAALGTGLPTLVTCHDAPWAILRAKKDVYRVCRLLMAYSALCHASQVTVVSPYLVRPISRMTRADIHVVSNPLPRFVLEMGANRPALRPSGSELKIAMVLNGWGAIKNPKPAMRAMVAIRHEYSSACMHLFGPGFGKGEEAHQWAISEGIADLFEFHGATHHRLVLQRLREMHLLVHPAIEESFGMSIAEAMAIGLPVVAGRASGAVPWLLRDGAGVLVDVKSSHEIAKGVLALVKDDRLFEMCSVIAKQRAIDDFSPAAVAQAYLECYANLPRQ